MRFAEETSRTLPYFMATGVYERVKKHPPITEATRRKMSLSAKARTDGRNKGKVFSEEWRKNLSESHKGIIPVSLPPHYYGEEHWNWSGDEIGYRGIHHWIRRQLGPATDCKNCGKVGTGRQIHWANKSRLYQRNINDWISLCAKCHKAYDGNKLSLV